MDTNDSEVNSDVSEREMFVCNGHIHVHIRTRKINNGRFFVTRADNTGKKKQLLSKVWLNLW